jgi:hypothetical protein
MLGCGGIVFDVTGGDGGARAVKLSRTRFVLGCRSEVGWDGVSPPMPISQMMMKTLRPMLVLNPYAKWFYKVANGARFLSIYVGDGVYGSLSTERYQK